MHFVYLSLHPDFELCMVPYQYHTPISSTKIKYVW